MISNIDIIHELLRSSRKFSCLNWRKLENLSSKTTSLDTKISQKDNSNMIIFYQQKFFEDQKLSTEEIEI